MLCPSWRIDAPAPNVLSVSTEPAYGQGYAQSVLRSQTWRTAGNSAGYLVPYLERGISLLDVGCGTGTITCDFASHVAPGDVVGVDVAPAVIDTASENARNLDNLTFRVADVADLRETFEAHKFDVVHAHQVLLHLRDPVRALRTMMSVTKPGGLVAVRDTDYAAAFWWPEDPRLDRWLEIYHHVAHHHGTEPDAGRRLIAWAHAAGAEDVTPTASIWCHSTDRDRAWWGGLWAKRIVDSSIAEQAVGQGWATRAELADISAAWRRWAEHPDAWFAIPHGEVLIRV